MTTTELTDKQLMEEIKKVKIEKSLPETWEKDIKRRYLTWKISREGHEMMIKFIKTIGEGKLLIDTWHGLSTIRTAIKDAGFILAKNRLQHDEYILFKNETIKKPSFTFNPELLDVEKIL